MYGAAPKVDDKKNSFLELKKEIRFLLLLEQLTLNKVKFAHESRG